MRRLLLLLLLLLGLRRRRVMLLLQELGRLNTRVAHDRELMCFLSFARLLSPSGQFE
jgi:hypothetical protein